jgi:hypothetical protein
MAALPSVSGERAVRVFQHGSRVILINAANAARLSVPNIAN